MAIAFLDVFCGISGDLLLGALVDAGVDPADMRAGLRGLPIPDWDLRVMEVRKSGLRGVQVQVVAGEEIHPPCYSDDNNGHGHDHVHGHHHDHGEEHLTMATSHTHGRSADEVIEVIRRGQLSQSVTEKSVAVVERIAMAEAQCHGVPRSEVHFHELGGLDTVIDVVGGVLGLELLGIERLYCSPLPVTHGYVDTAHGRLPVPAPAVARLLEGVATYGLDIEGETVTPTGAAMAVTLAQVGRYPSMKVLRTGWGAGQRDFPVPNLLRLFVGEPASAGGEVPTETIVLLEANLDDMSPEHYAAAMDRAFAAGAVDVWATPIQMKKNRPAFTISALVPPEEADAVARVLLRETSSFGVRRQLLQRQCLQRQHVTVATAYGDIRVKVGRLGDEVTTVAPEYADCLQAAEAHGVPVTRVHQLALAAYWSRADS